MLRRDLNQQGGSGGGMKNMYCTLYKYYSKHKIKKDHLGEVCIMQYLWTLYTKRGYQNMKEIDHIEE
jgi:hypothetical protein